MFGSGQTRTDEHGSLSHRDRYVEFGPMVTVCLLPFMVPGTSAQAESCQLIALAEGRVLNGFG